MEICCLTSREDERLDSWKICWMEEKSSFFHQKNLNFSKFSFIKVCEENLEWKSPVFRNLTFIDAAKKKERKIHKQIHPNPHFSFDLTIWNMLLHIRPLARYFSPYARSTATPSNSQTSFMQKWTPLFKCIGGLSHNYQNYYEKFTVEL